MNPPIYSKNGESCDNSSLNKNNKSNDKVSLEINSCMISNKFQETQHSKDFLPQELNEIKYNESIKYDTRSWCITYKNVLREKEIIALAIYGSSKFYPSSFRIAILFFTISSFFFFIGIFISEELITKRYNSAKKSDIEYVLSYEISKNFYAWLICVLILKLLSLFSHTNGDLLKLIRRSKKNVYYKKFIFLNEKKVYDYHFFYIIISSIVYWYFLTIFYTLFEYNQIIWLASTLLSISINFLFYMLIPFISSTLRI